MDAFLKLLMENKAFSNEIKKKEKLNEQNVFTKKSSAKPKADVKKYKKLTEADEEEADTTFGDVDDIPLSGDTEQDFNKVVDFLKSQSYHDLGDALKDIVDDPKLYNLLASGFGDGELAKVKMSNSTVGLPVQSLFPTQSEIGLDNSLKFPLKSDCSKYFSDSAITIVAPIITYRKTYVIDGHHRWSQLYMINPDAKISAINFNYEDSNPYRALRNMQGAIAVANKDVPSQDSKVYNLYDMDENQIKDYIEKNIQDVCTDSLIKQGVAKDKEGVIDYITKNALELKNRNTPFKNAPERTDMPQTDEKSIEVAKKGMTNI